MLALGTWEPFETDVFLHVLEKGMTVVDAGANIGQYTLEAARSVGDEGRVFAFEPEPRNFALLCRNIQANGYRNVTSVRKALSNRCGVARLALSPDNLGEHHIETSSVATDCIDVDILTLDEYFRDKPRKIDVIKMDTQGAETAIFEGMGGLLETNPDLILFAEFWPKGIRAAGHDPEKFLETLAASGFRVGIVNQEKARIEGLPTGHLGEIVRSLLHEDHARFYVNLLCLRGKAIRGPFGPHEWWHGPAYARAAFAGQN
jgi:FkbM family methyltransferase